MAVVGISNPRDESVVVPIRSIELMAQMHHYFISSVINAHIHFLQSLNGSAQMTRSFVVTFFFPGWDGERVPLDLLAC